ncbi:MAG TPA: YkyA family protein [Atopostipes sp.]|nr:YkyA family protein [Atopostipes sp.]
MKRFISTLVFVTVIALLGACSNQYNAAEDMHPHLERSVELEEVFKNAQAELVELERKENELYSEMIEINMNELEEVQTIADEAIAVAEQRDKLLDQEMESIKAAKEEFDLIDEFIEDLNEESQETANQMVEMMNNRYEAFENLFASYKKSIEEDLKLYNLLKDESLDQDTLNNQVDRVNETYESVVDFQNQFNEFTEEFNRLKKEFYESSELDVRFVENGS